MSLPNNPASSSTNKWMISTISGRYFNPLFMTAWDVNLWDIAWALSQQVRFNGHIPIPYDVLSHTTKVYSLASAELKTLTPIQEASLLLHDASEAYVGDMVRPLKQQFPEFSEREQEVQKVIFARFGIDYDQIDHEFITKYDNLALRCELHHFGRTASPEFDGKYPLPLNNKLAIVLPVYFIEKMKEVCTRLNVQDTRPLFEFPEILTPYVKNPYITEIEEDLVLDKNAKRTYEDSDNIRVTDNRDALKGIRI